MPRALLLLLLLALPAAAQDVRPLRPSDLRPGVGEVDPRVTVDVAAAPWRAIGRVQTEIGGRCTGALVGPALVLTAAHCLVARRTGAFVQPGSVHFLLGYDRGQFVAEARVRSYRRGPDYVPGEGPVGQDWALLTLERPIGTPDRILRLLRDPPPPRTPVMLGGYQRDRPEVILADAGCRLIGLRSLPSGVGALLHDCAATRGASGAPLLARGPDGAWAVIGVTATVSVDVALGTAAPAGNLPRLE